jgi:hypothetical protein
LELTHIDDKALYDLIEKTNLADKLESDPAWMMLREAGDRIVERAVTEFALRTNPNDIDRIIELQVIIKKYKYGLFDEIRILKQESDTAFSELQERGTFGEFMDSVKSKVGL